MKIVIHASRSIKWQERYFNFFREGFSKHGHEVFRETDDRPQNCDLAVLFGPNYWRTCELGYPKFLQVNRKFFGDVNDDVAISWNGFNGMGFFCVDEVDGDRTAQFLHRSPIKMAPWLGQRELPKWCLMGQVDTGRAFLFGSIEEYYKNAKRIFDGDWHYFRPHGSQVPLAKNVHDTAFSVTLNSTVAVETIMLGQPTVALDRSSPVWQWADNTLDGKEPDRADMLNYLAACQYHYTEIQNGYFWERLNPLRGGRLNGG